MTITPTETRILEAVEVRAERVEGARVLTGQLVPYGVPTTIGGFYVETVAPGTFSKSIREAARRLPLLSHHDVTAWPIGSADEWDDTPEGLNGVWTLADTEEARSVYELVRGGHLSAMSVGFQPIRSDWTFADGPGELDAVTRREARLLEASVVAVGAYESARVLVRTAEGRRKKTPRLDSWRTWLEANTRG